METNSVFLEFSDGFYVSRLALIKNKLKKPTQKMKSGTMTNTIRKKKKIFLKKKLITEKFKCQWCS
jgi:hypothetical protein